jgi:tetratricopeptide (TPR) repeat protein
MMLSAGCTTRSVVRPGSDQIINPYVADSIRPIYKVSSEAGEQAEDRAALLSSAPEIAPLLERAEANPADLQARAQVVAEYLSRKLYWGAYELLTDTPAGGSHDPDVNLSLAVIWDAWGQYNLAWQYGERAAANGAASPQAYAILGRIRLHQTEPAEAIVWYNRSLEYGRTATLLANVGYAHMLTSDWEKARINLEEAISLDDTLEEAHNNLAMVLSRTGDDKGALAHLLKTSRPAAAFNNLGILYLQEQRTEDALYYFEEALRVEPSYEIARRNLEALRGSAPANVARKP